MFLLKSVCHRYVSFIKEVLLFVFIHYNKLHHKYQLVKDSKTISIERNKPVFQLANLYNDLSNQLFLHQFVIVSSIQLI